MGFSFEEYHLESPEKPILSNPSSNPPPLYCTRASRDLITTTTVRCPPPALHISPDPFYSSPIDDDALPPLPASHPSHRQTQAMNTPRKSMLIVITILRAVCIPLAFTATVLALKSPTERPVGILGPVILLLHLLFTIRFVTPPGTLRHIVRPLGIRIKVPAVTIVWCGSECSCGMYDDEDYGDMERGRGRIRGQGLKGMVVEEGSGERERGHWGKGVGIGDAVFFILLFIVAGMSESMVWDSQYDVKDYLCWTLGTAEAILAFIYLGWAIRDRMVRKSLPRAQPAIPTVLGKDLSRDNISCAFMARN